MRRWRIPITTVAVFGAGGLTALGIGIVLFTGLSSATHNTRILWVEQSETLVDAMTSSIDVHLRPVVHQADWIAEHIENGKTTLEEPEELQGFIFGALAATPQVSGLGIVSAEGTAFLWDRERRHFDIEDWSHREEVLEWVDHGRSIPQSSWRTPVWSWTLRTTALLHATPLRRGDEYLGMLGQVVPISDLSTTLAEEFTEEGLTPFVLYDKEFILAHPLLKDWIARGRTASIPLLSASELGDPVLERIWSPDEKQPFFLRGLQNSEAVVVVVEGVDHVVLYRTVSDFGAPWTIGAYLNGDQHGREETGRILKSLYGGLVVLLLSVGAAVFAGRRISRPIEDIAAATELVEREALDEVPPLRGSRIRELDKASRSFNHMVGGLRERRLIRETLGRFVLEEVAGALLLEGGRLEPTEAEATILFCDLVSFTALTERLGPKRTVELLNGFFSVMVEILERHDGVVTQFQGDAILATFNVPIVNPSHAKNALNAALEMHKTATADKFGGQRLGIRIGINTGTVVAGAVGAEGRLSYTVHGDSVNLAARVEALNKDLDTRILVTANTAKLVQGFFLSSVGETTVRGQSSPITLYSLSSWPKKGSE